MLHFIEQLLASIQQLHPSLVYVFLFAVIFAETGLMFGFFLPGDSLLFLLGFLSSQVNGLNIFILAPLLFIAAVIGDSVGYSFGHKVGKRLFHKEDSLFFNKNHLLKAEKFYEKHGGKTIIFARFIPAIRTFAPIVAGMGNMHYPTFLMYNIVGGFIWIFGLLVAGYFLGQLIPSDKVELYLLIIVFVIIFLSVSPGIYHALKTPERRRNVYTSLKSGYTTIRTRKTRKK